ncbi:penicillin-binding protein 2, partial [Micromonospora sp. CPCC 205546]
MPPRSDEPRTGELGGGGISDARAYTPRGRTVREQRAGGRAERDGDVGPAEQRRTPRSTRSGDPFRPALQVLDGGRTGAGRAGRREAAGRSGVVRTVTPRAPRHDDDPPGPRRRTAPRPARRPERPAARRPSRKPSEPPRLAGAPGGLRVGSLLP